MQAVRGFPSLSVVREGRTVGEGHGLSFVPQGCHSVRSLSTLGQPAWTGAVLPDFTGEKMAVEVPQPQSSAGESWSRPWMLPGSLCWATRGLGEACAHHPPFLLPGKRLLRSQVQACSAALWDHDTALAYGAFLEMKGVSV